MDEIPSLQRAGWSNPKGPQNHQEMLHIESQAEKDLNTGCEYREIWFDNQATRRSSLRLKGSASKGEKIDDWNLNRSAP